MGTAVRPVPAFSLPEITAAAADALTAQSPAGWRPLHEVVIPALVDALRGHLSKLTDDPSFAAALERPAMAAVQQHLVSGRLGLALAEAFTEGDHAGPLEELVTAETLAGLDADRLCWAVIHFEGQRHLRLIMHFANKLAAQYPDREPEDLFGWGWQGLRVALRNFDPARGFAFSTYAGTRIYGYMRDGIRSESPIPKRLTTFTHRVARAEDKVAQRLGSIPDIQAIADELDCSPKDLAIMSRLSPAASVEELAETGRLRSALVDETDPAEAAIARSLRNAISDAVARLPEAEATAFNLLVVEDIGYAEAERRSGLSRRQLRQRCRGALARLRPELEDWRPVEVV